MSRIASFLSIEDRLRYLLDITGLNTLTKLADRSGVPLKTLRSAIKRNAVGPNTAEKLASRLNVPYKWIKDGIGGPPAIDVPNGASESDYGQLTYLNAWTAGEHLATDFNGGGGDEKTSVRVRLKAVMEAFNLDTGIALGLAMGLSSDLLGEILAKDRIDEGTARFVAERLGIEAHWLLTGQGPMQKPGSEIEGYRGEDSDQAARKIARTVDRARSAGPAFSMVPKAQTKLSAGGGIIPEEGTTGEEYAFRIDWLKEVATATTKVILVDVDGDSMAPTLLDKDTVLIDLGRTELRDGRIYAIAVGDVVQIKRLQWLPGDRIRVISDNPSYYTYEARPDELRIIGQMIWYARTVVK